VQGMDLSEYVFQVYGKHININDPNLEVNAMGRNVGINFNSARRMVNTLESHRLVKLAEEFEKEHEMVESIMQEYFENAVNISDKVSLAQIASRVFKDRLSLVQILEFFAGDKYKESVQKEVLETPGISGVPHFTIYAPNSTAR
jgi:predicted DsbA family dithiol-disulfide isomerase